MTGGTVDKKDPYTYIICYRDRTYYNSNGKAYWWCGRSLLLGPYRDINPDAGYLHKKQVFGSGFIMPQYAFNTRRFLIQTLIKTIGYKPDLIVYDDATKRAINENIA